MNNKDIIQCTEKSLFYQMINRRKQEQPLTKLMFYLTDQSLTRQYKIIINDKLRLCQSPDQLDGCAIIDSQKQKTRKIKILDGLL